MSTHHVPVIRINEVQTHPNADALEIIPVGGWQAVVRKGDFKVGDRAVYIEPDYVVPTTAPEFSFLNKKGTGLPHRLKAVKLRGAISFGLLIPLSERLSQFDEGDCVMNELNIVRYEPTIKVQRGADAIPGPAGLMIPKFDLESYKNYGHHLNEGEMVVITEKIHGTNSKFVFWEDKFYLGSRNNWLGEPTEGKTTWWHTAAEQLPQIERWCRAHPGHVLFGETYGMQELKYGLKPGEIRFAAFAVLNATTGQYLHNDLWRQSVHIFGVPAVPVLHAGRWTPGLLQIAEEDTCVGGGHLSEGIVITPEFERWDDRLGRVALKHISQRYWLL